jgi:hypothetical protein
MRVFDVLRFNLLPTELLNVSMHFCIVGKINDSKKSKIEYWLKKQL